MEHCSCYIKHKEEGYHFFPDDHHFFPDDHVRMVGFSPSFPIDSNCLFSDVMKPSFRTTGSYSTVVARSKISGYVLGAECNSKAGAGGCCKHVAVMLYNILNYVELGLVIIPEDKTCTDTSQQWNRPRNIPGDGPIFVF